MKSEVGRQKSEERNSLIGFIKMIREERALLCP